MDPVITLSILFVLMVVLIYLSGYFSGTETALTNISAARIADMSRKKEKNTWFIIKLKRNMDRTLVTILIGNNIVNIILSAVTALIANELFHTIGVSIAIGIITFLIIVFGEIGPKSHAIIYSKEICQRNSKFIYFLMRVLKPLIIVFLTITQWLLKLKGDVKTETHLLASDESIKNLAALSESEGIIKSIEREIIYKVFRFGDSKIEDVMVSMSEVFYLSKNYTTKEASKIITERGFTRIPILDKNKKVSGLLYSKDLLIEKGDYIMSLVKPVFIVSVKSDVTDTFNKMKRKRIHMAIVEDSFGKHIGIVTLEDILEQIVGDIHDEYSELKYKDKTRKHK
ncbi:MAG: HlyC/CorC family transporter [Ignavibacteria bacterium]|nr:HlyC/CorC family transporter [Ignavibacteria bacterium]